MYNTFKKIDISSEFLVIPWRRGVKLVPPSTSITVEEEYPLLIDIKTFLLYAMNVYFVAPDGILLEVNEEAWINCGFQNRQDILGKVAGAIFTSASAKECVLHDQMALSSASLIIKEHLAIRDDGTELKCISLKMPFYGTTDKVLGILGLSIVEHKHRMADCLIQLASLGILSASTQTKINNSFYQNLVQSESVSERELECLNLFAKGKTAKEAAKLLKIKPRTVETHCIRLRKKFNVKTTTGLVAKAMREGIIY